MYTLHQKNPQREQKYAAKTKNTCSHVYVSSAAATSPPPAAVELRALVHLGLYVDRRIAAHEPVGLEGEARVLRRHHRKIFHSRYVSDAERFRYFIRRGVNTKMQIIISVYHANV